ncbi:hypothetical protein BTN49_2594 [Candidatus Enterovibrio escicola]|uniref:Uncharacterized protein n=1 Tax=Candidatus Enterovibrio escicola TaxID=1927127 RepID=A0A2A5T0T2_9GAMM|nr:hypothetical protein BTN49_2594 [Candidatus Enterovibrio escacola]
MLGMLPNLSALIHTHGLLGWEEKQIVKRAVNNAGIRDTS